MPHVPVRKVMTEDLVTIASDLPVDVALETMRSNSVRRLPVVSATGRVVGILTLYDALLATRQETDNFMSAVVTRMPTVKDAMTANVVTIGPEESVARAARIMTRHKIGGLPVVENHKIVGIVTESDLFRYLANILEPEEGQETT